MTKGEHLTGTLPSVSADLGQTQPLAAEWGARQGFAEDRRLTANGVVDRRAVARTVAQAAMIGLALTTVACDKTTKDAKEGEAASAVHEPASAKDCCMGKNDCKGKGGCAVPESHSCQGQNECAGKGGCSMRDCKKKK